MNFVVKNEGVCVISLTGRRPNKLAGYNLSAPFYIRLQARLEAIIARTLAQYPTVELHSGMALGANTVWAQAIVRAKAHYGERVRFVADIPDYIPTSSPLIVNVLHLYLILPPSGLGFALRISANSFSTWTGFTRPMLFVKINENEVLIMARSMYAVRTTEGTFTVLAFSEEDAEQMVYDQCISCYSDIMSVEDLGVVDYV